MPKNIKHIKTYILTFALVLLTFSANAQEVRVIDNKGTIQTVNNNTVTTSTTAPTLPLENDVWFDTTNNQIKIYDAVTPWKVISNITPENIYNADGNLTSNRALNGNGNSLDFTNFSRFDIRNSGFTNIESTGSIALRATGGLIDLIGSDTRINEDLILEKNLIDINSSAGTSGQILTSTGTGVEWANNQQNTVTKTSNSSTSTPATFSFPVGYTPIENDFFIYELTSGEHSTIYIYNDGAWEQIAPTKASRIFYPPSIAIDASTTGSGRTINLYTQYTAQFNSPAIGSTSAPATIPTYNADELYYYVTDYDTSILTINSIDDNGLMTYSVDNVPTNDNTIINVVFVVK
ncbi:hypothetical protein [Tenacibaculum sp.]|uniref:hypothetical protein n=1 Tax=Tenacibaculum sp. TaxID=1906242 RepID=UPI003AA7EE35